MSVVAARVYLAITSSAVVLTGVWVAVVPAPSTTSTLTGVSCLVAIVGLLSGLAILPSFGEVRLGEAEVGMRRVLGSRRTLSATDFDQVVVIERLLLPSRSGGAGVMRLVFLSEGRRVAAITPRQPPSSAGVEHLGTPVARVADPIGVFAAHRRCAGSVSVGELVVATLPWVALAIGAIVALIAGWLLVA